MSVTTNFLQDLIPGSVSAALQGCPGAAEEAICTAGHCTEPMFYKAKLKGLGINLPELGEQGTTELCQVKVHVLVEPA